MPESETSYADRLQRGRSMKSAIAGFIPPFAPPDATLLPAAFDTFLNGLNTLNTTAATKKADWQSSVADRIAMVKDIKARALRVSSHVKSNAAWKAQFPAVKAAAEALRGYRIPKPKAEPHPEVVQPKARQQGDQSFADIKNLLDKLTAALGHVPTYDTGAPADLTIATLSALATDLDALNQLVATKEQALISARTKRAAGYETLKDKMKAIKEAAVSQYGSRSPQHTQVRAIRV